MSLITKFVDLHIQTARRMANEFNVQNPAQWQAKIDEVERLLLHEGPIQHLIELYREYSAAQINGLNQVLVCTQRGDYLVRPPLPLIDDLRKSLRIGLLSLGLPVSTPLLQAYERTPLNAVERLALLKLLAEIGDPTLEPFMVGLTPENIKDALQAEQQLSEQVQDMISELAQPDAVDLSQEVMDELRSIKAVYRNALEQRRIQRN